jgi:hypothetical protein
MCWGQAIATWVPELILLSVGALDEFLDDAHGTCNKKKNVGLECFWALRRKQNEAIPTVYRENWE